MKSLIPIEFTKEIFFESFKRFSKQISISNRPEDNSLEYKFCITDKFVTTHHWVICWE